MDLRVRLLRFLLGSFALLLVLACALVATSLRKDVQEEVTASARLVALMLRVGELRAAGQPVAPEALQALLAPGGLRHVRVALDGAAQRSNVEQLLPSGAADGGAWPWVYRLAGLGLGPASLPAYRVPLGDGGQQLVLSVDPRSEVDEVLEDAVRMLGMFGLFAAMAVAAAWWASDRALRPVRALEDGLARMGQGDLAPRLPRFELREFQRVAGAIEALAHSLQQARANERRLGQRLMALQESERQELARELHDEFGQGLAAMGAAAAFVERHAGSASAAVLVECASDIRQAAGRMARQVRGLLRQLRPHGLEGMGMRAALVELIDGSRLRAEGVVLEARLPQTLPPLSDAAGLALYRTVQEALTNVLKHAQARRVRLAIERVDGHRLRLTVDDDGQGSAPAVLREARAGVMGMHERAEMAGGGCRIAASDLGGLRVSLWLPLAPEDNQEGDTHHGECAVAG